MNSDLLKNHKTNIDQRMFKKKYIYTCIGNIETMAHSLFPVGADVPDRLVGLHHLHQGHRVALGHAARGYGEEC